MKDNLYDQTCFVTRMPIRSGMPCCAFLVAPTNICQDDVGRPESWYAPVSLPVIMGEYNGRDGMMEYDPEQVQEVQEWLSAETVEGADQKLIHSSAIMPCLLHGDLSVCDAFQSSRLLPVFVHAEVWDYLAESVIKSKYPMVEMIRRKMGNWKKSHDQRERESLMNLICLGSTMQFWFSVQECTSEDTAICMYILYFLANSLRQPFIPYSRNSEMSDGSWEWNKQYVIVMESLALAAKGLLGGKEKENGKM